MLADLETATTDSTTVTTTTTITTTTSPTPPPPPSQPTICPGSPNFSIYSSTFSAVIPGVDWFFDTTLRSGKAYGSIGGGYGAPWTIDSSDHLQVASPGDPLYGDYAYLDYTETEESSYGAYLVRFGFSSTISELVAAGVADWLTCYADPSSGGELSCLAGALRKFYFCPCSASNCPVYMQGVFMGTPALPPQCEPVEPFTAVCFGT